MALWKQKVEYYFELKTTPDQDKVKTLLLLGGNEALRKYNSWNLSATDKHNSVKVWKKFKEYGEVDQNFRVARLFLQGMKQVANVESTNKPEPVDDFIERCRVQARRCDFRDQREIDERLIEQLIAGSLYTDVQKELLSKDRSLTLDEAIQYARMHEASLIHMNLLAEAQQQAQAQAEANPDKSVSAVGKQRKCSKCGLHHPRNPKSKCPAYGSVCNYCQKKGHWEKVCRSRKAADNKPEEKKGRKKSTRDKETYKFLREKFESAKWFIACIQQRRETLLKIMQAILERQYQFFEKGPKYLKPMIYKDIAEAINMDISTISRVVNGKYVQNPMGIHELKYFFSEGLSTDSGEEVSNKHIKERLKEIIDDEEKKKPYSDDKLAELLNGEGIHIARRTVAKYREQLKVPVARLRKEL